MTKAKRSLREQILEAGDKRARAVPVEADLWGGVTVYVHEMSVRGANEFIQVAPEMLEEGDGTPADLGKVVDIILPLLHDADGEQLFSEEDRDFLLDQPVKQMTAFAQAVMEAAGLSKDAVGEAKNG